MRRKILNENDRFEIIGRLYEEDTGHLRPGKDDSWRNSSSPENVERFAHWLKERAFVAAIEDIACQCALLNQIDIWSYSAPELNMSNYDEDEVSELNGAMIQIASLFIGKKNRRR
jgi:hypothetical protein